MQIGEFSFIIAGLGNSLGVLHPALYPIIVASSVVTTFLTPYIMKASVPCYEYLYKHAPAGLKAKMDKREQDVELAEQQAKEPKAKSQEKSGKKSPIQKAISHTYITKRLVNLFIENMSAHEKEENGEALSKDL